MAQANVKDYTKMVPTKVPHVVLKLEVAEASDLADFIARFAENEEAPIMTVARAIREAL